MRRVVARGIIAVVLGAFLLSMFMAMTEQFGWAVGLLVVIAFILVAAVFVWALDNAL